MWQGSINQPWVWALTGINASDAWEQFLLNTLAAEAVAYGDQYWAGVWTSSDAVDSFLSTDPGKPSWDNFPVLCTHRHAWPLYSLTKLSGIGFSAQGIRLSPAPLPRALLCGTTSDVLWSIDTPVVSVVAFANGSWSGRYMYSASESDASYSRTSFSAVLPLQTGNACFPSHDTTTFAFEVRTASVALFYGKGHTPPVSSSVHAVALRPPTPAESAVWGSVVTHATIVADFDLPVPVMSTGQESVQFTWTLTLE